ncbi:MAG: amidohydrolase family protein, partial [Planctomycetota bacterium]
RSNVTGLLKRFPRLVVILAHGGIPHFGFYWPLIKKYDTLYTDLSGDYVSRTLAKKIIRKVGPRKVIWGTDGPYGLRNRDPESAYHHTFRHEMAKVDGLGLKDDQLRLVFSENLLRILRLNDG